MIHKIADHLNWICSLNDNEEIESVLINKKTKEIEKKVLSSTEEAYALQKDFLKLGWVKGYVPDVNIIFEKNNTQSFKITN